MDITALYFYWNKWKIEIVKLIIPPSIVGILIGSLTFHNFLVGFNYTPGLNLDTYFKNYSPGENLKFLDAK